MLIMEFFKDKHVLVTGAAGFVGSHLVDALLGFGAKITGIDNLITGSRANIGHLRDNPNFTFIEADVSEDPTKYLPEEIEIDLVLHFASPASPPRYQENPVETYLVNSQGTHNLLQFLKSNYPDARFVFASTSEIYGDPLEHPQKEDYWGNVNPNGVRSCYDEAKRMGETICGVHQRDFGMDVRIVRIFNTYGPRMDMSDGRIIPNLISQAKANQPLTIYGDGSQTRSFCYVSDLVHGILLMASKEKMSGETINLGNPHEELTILQTAEIIKKVLGKPELQFEFRELPGDDPTRRKPDITKAQLLLGWEPRVGFVEGVEKTVNSL